MNETINKNEMCYRYFISFLLISIIGWIYEVLLGIFVFHEGFVNRGFLWGPYCPIYGFGALLFILTAYKRRNTPVMFGKVNIKYAAMFIFVTAVSTITELIASYITDFAVHKKLWNYKNYAFNFQGRIALNPSIRFGIGGMIIIYLIEPALEKQMDRIGARKTKIIAGIVFVLFAIDCIARIFLGSNFTEEADY